MKLCIYQQPFRPVSLESFKDFLMFVTKDDELIVDTIYDFDELLARVGNGEYAAIFASHPEGYTSSKVQYHELMNEAIATHTNVYETTSFCELTASFIKEKNNSQFNLTQMNTIKRYNGDTRRPYPLSTK